MTLGIEVYANEREKDKESSPFGHITKPSMTDKLANYYILNLDLSIT